MPVSIRLMRIGKRGQPSYRIVAVDQRKKRNGAYLEKLGFYDPIVSPVVLNIETDKVKSWLSKGAVLSEGARKLLSKLLK